MNEILSGIAGAISLANQIYTINKASKDAQTRLLIADLQMKLSELQLKIAELNTRHAELMTENLKLKTEAKVAQNAPVLVVNGGHYYKEDGDGPYCTPCWDGSKKLIRLSPMVGDFKLLGDWKCGVCKNIV